MSDFLVECCDLRQCRVAESPPPAVEPGQALLRVDSFGLTANNVTYAVMGEAMHYWDFFPAEEGWGRVPMWGFAEVERSEADGVDEGARVFGYLPPSTHLRVTPADALTRAASSTPPRTGRRCRPPTRRRLPARAARRGRADRPHLARERRLRRGARRLRPHRRL